ncbi:MAG: hypothetical protein IJ572_01860 [Bacilli bacterium]|nr:hypothetical protein [Bacilli bacterium]
MKKLFKMSNILSFLLGAIIFGGIVGVSAYSFTSDDVEFTPKDSTWKKSNGEDIGNVKDAIDELYNYNKSIFGITSDNVLFEQSVNRDSVASKDYTATEEEIVVVALGVTGKQRYSINLTTTGTIIKDTGTTITSDTGFYRLFRTAVVHLSAGESVSVKCDGYVYGLSAYSLTHIK